MTPWINLVSLIIATKLFLYFYVKSVGPAALEQRIGVRRGPELPPILEQILP